MFLVYIFLCGTISAAACLTIQVLGSLIFAHFKIHDTKELAGLVGLRVSALFAIAAGLIFSSSHTHYTEAKISLLEEVRLIGTMYFIASSSPDLPSSRGIRVKLVEYAQASATDLEQPETTEQSTETINRLLIEICKLTATNLETPDVMNWLQTQLQHSCIKLIELRGKKRVWMLTSHVEIPFWIFFSISLAFLAFLLGAFEKQPLNLAFTSLFYFAAGATAILIYSMGDPYHGPNRLSAAPLTQLIAKMNSFDNTK